MNITVCFASDDPYAEHMGVAISSILRSRAGGETFSFFILDGGISAENKKKILALRENAGTEITFIPVDNSPFEGLPVPGSLWSVVIYYRLLIPKLLPGRDKVIYLDGDVIVRESLAPLWQTGLGEAAVGAVEDVADQRHIERLRKGGVSLSRYVNAGVLLLNLKKWRAEELTERFLSFMRENPELLAYPDQDALNIVLKDSIVPLDPVWNTQTSGEPVEQTSLFQQAARHAAVIHFLGAKPWLCECRNPFQHLYEECWSDSPWKESCRRFQRKRDKLARRDRRRKIFRIRLIGGKEKCITLFGKTLYHKIAD